MPRKGQRGHVARAIFWLSRRPVCGRLAVVPVGSSPARARRAGGAQEGASCPRCGEAHLETEGPTRICAIAGEVGTAPGRANVWVLKGESAAAACARASPRPVSAGWALLGSVYPATKTAARACLRASWHSGRMGRSATGSVCGEHGPRRGAPHGEACWPGGDVIGPSVCGGGVCVRALDERESAAARGQLTRGPRARHAPGDAVWDGPKGPVRPRPPPPTLRRRSSSNPHDPVRSTRSGVPLEKSRRRIARCDDWGRREARRAGRQASEITYCSG